MEKPAVPAWRAKKSNGTAAPGFGARTPVGRAGPRSYAGSAERRRARSERPSPAPSSASRTASNSGGNRAGRPAAGRGRSTDGTRRAPPPPPTARSRSHWVVSSTPSARLAPTRRPGRSRPRLRLPCGADAPGPPDRRGSPSCRSPARRGRARTSPRCRGAGGPGAPAKRRPSRSWPRAPSLRALAPGGAARAGGATGPARAGAGWR
jgi:hypothetical protein